MGRGMRRELCVFWVDLGCGSGPRGLPSTHTHTHMLPTPVESREKALVSRVEGGRAGCGRSRAKGTIIVFPKADPESRIWV